VKRKDIVKKALKFATKAHTGQVRKYTGEPYINHPIAVARTVKLVSSDKRMEAAALLHDVVEDTDVTIEEIIKEFGVFIGSLVADLTDVSRPDQGNRKIRKNIDFEHTADASPSAKTIKLADLIDNTSSITLSDEGFARVYMGEKKRLLSVLTKGDPRLFNMARAMVVEYFKKEEMNAEI
jgi:(p)ppGpp synthase/HD superfamily hydrolase